jgi:hypothetical protein
MGRDHQTCRFLREIKILGASQEAAGKGQDRRAKEEKDTKPRHGGPSPVEWQKGVRNLFLDASRVRRPEKKVPDTFLFLQARQMLHCGLLLWFQDKDNNDDEDGRSPSNTLPSP